ncbi:MAG TPA: endonuclease/exonuclease/phosphatase family protein [Chitinophagaceae bacterium]|nr:endonuclease/exonuclease/phosphatase family protein [Chitinophagaceae bacterium]
MHIYLAAISILLILSVFLSLIKSDFWVYKILEYPRLQKLMLIAVVTGGWCLLWPFASWFYRGIVCALFISVIYLLYKIWPYTFFAKKEMQRARPGDPANELKVFAANVLQDNTEYHRLIQQIRECDPDVLFLVEINDAWAKAISELENEYPYRLVEPRDNTYGLLFYSRFKVEKARLTFLVKNDIPSVDAVVVLPSGEKMQLWCLHPEPPVPGENLYSTAKDKELMKVALKVKDCSLPCIVLGDLNDVAWSHTTEIFRKTSELLDPRRGRGFYSTFSAHHWLIRFPLDYIFCSKEFFLISMRRLPKNGSDHFATLTHLAFKKDIKEEQAPQKADGKELANAHEMATQTLKE